VNAAAQCGDLPQGRAQDLEVRQLVQHPHARDRVPALLAISMAVLDTPPA
jgi:hypothetical protein